MFCKPIALGADIVIEAVTKYLCGHSDLLLGSISVSNETLAGQIHRTIMSLGSGVAPDDCFLALRGLETASVRLAHVEHAALAIAEMLEAGPDVTEVLHPALPSFKGHDLWRRQFTGSSGLFSFTIPDEDDTVHKARFDRLQCIKIGASWGGVHSLFAPQKPTVPRIAANHQGSRLIRLSIGLESINDITADIERFLQ